MADITLHRETFYEEVYEPYNRAVKNGKYNKIPYNVWRTIRDWSCDHQWTGYYIGITAVSCGYHIMLEHNNRVCPEIITVAFNRDFDDPAFAEYLHDHMAEITKKDVKVLNAAIQTAKVTTDAVVYDSCIQSAKASFYAYDTKINEINANDRYFAIGHDCEPNSFHLKADSIYIDEKPIPEYLKSIGIEVKEKENNNMKFGNFDFGPVDSSVRMSLYGMAVKSASGAFVAYDAKTNQIMDVDILNVEGANKFMYKLPVPLKDVRSGDVIVHSRRPMFVQMVGQDNRIKVLDIYDGEEKTIVPARSPFGFDFITKVVSLIDVTGSASGTNPFGNMLPLLLMNENKNLDDMLPLMLMGQGNMAQNPMLMYMLLSKDNKMNDMLPFLMMCGSPFNPAGENAKND